MTASHVTDVAIIGAGPVGLFAIFELGMLRIKTHTIDALDMPGGQCAALYPEKPIYDIPGYPRIDAQSLVDRLMEQAAPFKPVHHWGQQVTELAPEKEGWRLTTSTGPVVEARAVVIAAGVGAFGPNRPPLPGIEAFEGKSVHYLVKRRDEYRGKRVVIAGGGDSAVDWALSLAEVAARIMVVHRRAKFRAAPESEARLKELADAGRIDLVVPYQLKAIEGEGGRLGKVVVTTLDGHERALEADALLPFFGLAMNLGPIAHWGLNLDRNLIQVEPSTCQSNRAGIFAIGDIATYPGKLKLILSGFAEAALAAHAIRPLVFPGAAYHFQYSTTQGIPVRA
jgi:thioredoxin reductase (NADPH)